jgi:hypothetical protein
LARRGFGVAIGETIGNNLGSPRSTPESDLEQTRLALRPASDQWQVLLTASKSLSTKARAVDVTGHRHKGGLVTLQAARDRVKETIGQLALTLAGIGVAPVDGFGLDQIQIGVHCGGIVEIGDF